MVRTRLIQYEIDRGGLEGFLEQVQIQLGGCRDTCFWNVSPSFPATPRASAVLSAANTRRDLLV